MFWNKMKIISCTDSFQLRINKHISFSDNFKQSNSIGSYSMLA